MKNVTLFLCVVFLCISCSPSKFLTSDVMPDEITEMLKIEPLSYISLIESGNRSVYNDSISKNTQLVLNESLETFKNKLHLSSEEIVLTDSLIKNRLEREINFLIMSAERKRSINGISITPLIDSLLDANNKRFGLIIVQSGFTRAKGNYGGQIAKGIGIGILTLGMYYQTPIKANSTLYAMIVDNKNKNVSFYNKSVLQDKEPTEKENIIKQIKIIFEKYFWDKK